MAWLRRPASYSFSVSDDREPLPPGMLELRMQPQALDAAGGQTVIPQAAVEIVLDASGSMLQRLNGVRRIEVARQALGALADERLPLGTQLAFGCLAKAGPDQGGPRSRRSPRYSR